MAPHATVYVVVPEGPKGLGTPKYFRGQGGISESRLSAPGEEETLAEWQRLRDIRPHQNEQSIAFEDLFDVLTVGFPDDEHSWRRSAWSRIDPRGRSPARRVWIYELATSPNMLVQAPPDGRSNEIAFTQTLGGTVWSQVSRFTEISLSHPTIRDGAARLTGQDAWYPDWMNSVEVSWMLNPDYDSRWEAYGATQGIPSGVFNQAPEGMTRVELATDIMALVTSSRLLPDLRRRQTLRELLDWDTDREPERNFPLLRHAQPLRLEAAALPLIDWSLVQIPPEVQLALASGLATAAQCAAALQPFRNFFLRGPKGPKGRREVQADACDEIAGLIKSNSNVPPGCRKIKKVELEIALSDDFWAGTFDIVGGTLSGTAGKAEFVFGDAPDRGTEKKIAVDMQTAFGSEEIDIGGIDKIDITVEGDFWRWTPLRNDQFKIKDITLRAQCADPAFQAQNNKYLGLNSLYRHPGGWSFSRLKKKTVGTLHISTADWSFVPPCSIIKSLSYDFRIANVWGGGTNDDIYLTLGSGKQIFLASDPGAGFHKNGEINLKDTFGNDTINIRDFGRVALEDKEGEAWFSGDKWTFEGITFSATCADFPKRMQLKKFESVNQGVQYRQEGVPTWTGDISPEDWQELA
ncbi:uncharacterized protein MAM_05688 [Metarhizium album ARSEF 1941]|uniref:Protein-tyrosine phosphatase n=1 Tax=Metarhizium album (strain ARSEF 1941) TaxID=1081103 RepID=A0A0B2WRX7_METAS|nr:uncharacterized protein MAM_05688 [Metarhizium album ARSEF 1941]KHN96399.1 hypothetical protein MAM_05688 [Metarhizium album ARSEF 1941]